MFVELEDQNALPYLHHVSRFQSRAQHRLAVQLGATAAAQVDEFTLRGGVLDAGVRARHSAVLNDNVVRLVRFN